MPIGNPIHTAPQDGTRVTLYRSLGNGKYYRLTDCIFWCGQWVNERTKRAIAWKPHYWTFPNGSLCRFPQKREIVIIGRSPFLHDVDVHNLVANYPTLGINHVAQDYAVTYGFSYHGIMPRSKAKHHITVVGKAGRHKRNVEIIMPCANINPFIKKKYQEGVLKVAWRMYSVALAVNWAMLKGYNTVYLVAIDHHEDEKYFKHYSGVDGDNPETPTKHRGVKDFIRRCAVYIDVYQTNPAAKWPIPHKPIGELYQ